MRHTVLRHMLILSESNVQTCLSMKDCLEASRQALISVANGTSVVPTRLGIPYHHHDHDDHHDHGTTAEPEDWTLFKPAAVTTTTTSTTRDHHHHDTFLGCKIVSIRRDNPVQHNLPLVPATVLNIDAATGLVNAVVAGTYLTAARTAAGSALATAASLREQPLHHLVVFGAGLQAQLHIQAIAYAMPQQSLPLVTIINRTEPRALALKEFLRSAAAEESTTGSTDFPAAAIDCIQTIRLENALAVSQALATASCVVTATNTAVPLFDGTLLPVGCHINGIGSYTPDMQEVSARTVDRCRVWIDTPEARAVGDLQHLSRHHPVQLLGQVLLEQQQQQQQAAKEGSSHHHVADNSSAGRWDCTFYKAVGTAIQDVITAHVVVEKARELGIGVEVDMS